MSQNGQTHFKNLAPFAARFLKYGWPFGTLCTEGLRQRFWVYSVFLEDWQEQ